MDEGDWRRVSRLIGIVYLPIFLFIVFVFLIIQYQSAKIEKVKTDMAQVLPLDGDATTSTQE